MHRIRIFRITKILIVTSVLFINLSFPLFNIRSGWQDSKIGIAATQATKSLYLPMITKSYPPIETVFGIEMHSIAKSGGLDYVTESETTWVRRNALLWANVEQEEGEYQWTEVSSLENELINASNKGLDVILVVRRTPEWAQMYDGVFCGPIRADKLAAFGNFMYEAVERYSKPPYNVKYWQIWNEPDVDREEVPPDQVYGCWAENDDDYFGGGYYGDMLSVVYPRVKEADSQAQLIIGGLLVMCNMDYPTYCNTHAMKFLEGILLREGARDGGNYFDGVAFHGYDEYYNEPGKYGNGQWQSEWFDEGPTIVNKAEFIRGVLEQYNVSGKYLMASEIALRNCRGDPSDPDYLNTKAYYIPQAYAASIAIGLKASIWYSIRNSWCAAGLLSDEDERKLGYQTYKFARNMLKDAEYISDITEYSYVNGYKLDRGDRVIWILWSVAETPQSIQLPETPIAAWDAFGNAVSITNQSLSLDIKPIYLEWVPAQ